MTRDPRYDAARATSQSERGWDMRPYDEPTFMERAVVVLIKASPALFVLGVVISLWWA